jgi:transcriptional regulator with XRE-family HTH domain
MSEAVVSGERIKGLRHALGLTADELASQAGLSTGAIFLLEANKRPQTAATTVAKIACVLGTSLEYLLALTDDPAPVAAEQRQAE